MTAWRNDGSEEAITWLVQWLESLQCFNKEHLTLPESRRLLPQQQLNDFIGFILAVACWASMALLGFNGSEECFNGVLVGLACVLEDCVLAPYKATLASNRRIDTIVSQ
jgi:hypothetical protein